MGNAPGPDAPARTLFTAAGWVPRPSSVAAIRAEPLDVILRFNLFVFEEANENKPVERALSEFKAQIVSARRLTDLRRGQHRQRVIRRRGRQRQHGDRLTFATVQPHFELTVGCVDGVGAVVTVDVQAAAATSNAATPRDLGREPTARR